MPCKGDNAAAVVPMVTEEITNEPATLALQVPIDERSCSEILQLLDRMVDGVDVLSDDPDEVVLNSHEAVMELDIEVHEDVSSSTEMQVNQEVSADEVVPGAGATINMNSREAPEGIESTEVEVEQPRENVEIAGPDLRYVPIETWSDRTNNTPSPPPENPVEPGAMQILEDGEVRLRGPNGRRRRYNNNRHLEYDDYVPAVLDSRRRSLSPMVPTRNELEPRPWSPIRYNDAAAVPRCKTRGTMFGDLKPIPHDPRVDPPARTCFNCWQERHNKQNCPRPQVHKFCFNCGRRGVDMETCPRCEESYRTFVQERANSERYHAAQERKQVAERQNPRMVRIAEPARGPRARENDPSADVRDRTPIRPPGIPKSR